MFRSCQHIVFAIGLIVLPCSGQAQEKTQSEQGETATEQEPAQTFPIPLPVDIIEDEATADARKHREAESSQNEKDDLVAQQGMNRATQAMNEATQNMALYSLISTVFVGIGTILLIITLCLTRQANSAAQEAVEVTREMGQRQMRAYVSGRPVFVHSFDESRPAHIKYNVHNFGQTPANDVSHYAVIDVIPYPIEDSLKFPDFEVPDDKRLTLFNGDEVTGISEARQFSEMEIAAIRSGTHRIGVFGRIVYLDKFNEGQTELNKARTTQFAACVRADRETLGKLTSVYESADLKFEFEMIGQHNHAT